MGKVGNTIASLVGAAGFLLVGSLLLGSVVFGVYQIEVTADGPSDEFWLQVLLDKIWVTSDWSLHNPSAEHKSIGAVLLTFVVSVLLTLLLLAYGIVVLICLFGYRLIHWCIASAFGYWWTLLHSGLTGAIVASIAALVLALPLLKIVAGPLGLLGERAVVTVAGSGSNQPKQEMVMVNRDFEVKQAQLAVQLRHVAEIVPGAGALPSDPREWRGWLDNVRERVAFRAKTKTNRIILEHLEVVNKVAEQMLQLQQHDQQLTHLGQRTKVQSLERDRDQKQLEVELKKLDVESKRLDRELTQLSNPAAAPRKKKTAVDELRSCVASIQEIEDERARLAKKYPDQADDINETAKDMIFKIRREGL